MRNPAPIWSRVLHDPGRLAALQYTHVQPRRGATACRLLEAPQPPPLALVITHETPDRFTACTGGFFYVYLLVCPHSPAEPSRTGASRAVLYLYHNRQKSPQRGAGGGAERPTPAPRSAATPRAAGGLHLPRLESMVKPRSRGGQVCRRAGSRRAEVAALLPLLPLLPLLLLLKSVFLPFCPFWAFCDFCKSPFCGF